MLLLLNGVENLEGASLGVLAPDIRDSFGVSDGVIVFVSAASSAFIVLGALPMGWLADRYRRPPIIAAAAVVFSVFVFLSGLAVNAFTLFLARLGVGVAKSSNTTVHPSLIADAYPIGVRGRLSATNLGSGLLIGAISPALVGAIATLAGGPDGWRWAFFILGLPALVLAFFALRIPEAPRGQFEMKDVLGEVIDTRPTPMSVESVFSRLKQIRTFRHAMIAFAALGFGLFTGPILQGLYVEERFDLDALERGLLGSVRRAPGALRPALRRPGLRRPLPPGPGEGAPPGRPPDHPRRDRGPDPVRDAERRELRPRRGGGAGPAVHRVHHGRAGPAVDHALPPPGHGGRPRIALHLLHRGHRRGAPLGVPRPTPSAPRARC